MSFPCSLCFSCDKWAEKCVSVLRTVTSKNTFIPFSEHTAYIGAPSPPAGGGEDSQLKVSFPNTPPTYLTLSLHILKIFTLFSLSLPPSFLLGLSLFLISSSCLSLDPLSPSCRRLQGKAWPDVPAGSFLPLMRLP